MKVLNKNTDRTPKNAIYIGRPSKWGNPFIIGKDGNRAEVIEKYRKYLKTSGLIKDVKELKGQDLACYCSPKPCHGDILLELANKTKLECSVVKEVIGDVTLYLGDCLEILPELGVTTDLIVTDPPYGTGFISGRADVHVAIKNDHKGFDVQPYLMKALKTLKRGRHVYIFGPLDVSQYPLCSPAELIWDKVNFGLGDLSIPWGPQHEKITFAVYEISKVNREKNFGALTARLRKGSILRSLRAHSGRSKHHPTEKPINILQQMIESSSVLGETVLDPFMGSGSTLVAAIMSGRKAIGIEIEQKYFDLACERVENVTKALKNVQLAAHFKSTTTP